MRKLKYDIQKNIVFNAFLGSPKTMLMVADITGVERAGVCRYVAKLRETNSISKVKTGLCKITNHRAGYYTTIDLQLKLF
ncbi:MAG: hypothetical protein ACOYLE_10660 [Bacteroidales bacterium]